MDASQAKSVPRQIRYRRIGVFNLAYEDAALPLTLRLRAFLLEVEAFRERVPYVKRLLADTVKLAPAAFVMYVATTLWIGIYKGISLYFLSVMFGWFWDSFKHGGWFLEAYRSFAMSWILVTLIDIAVGRLHARTVEVLIKRFRAHFIPQLIRASLRVDLLSVQDVLERFPIEGRYGSEFPGGPFLRQSSQAVERFLGLISQVFVLLYAISLKRSPEREVLSCFCVARGFVWWLAPGDDVGVSAYVYWPHDQHFQRMKTLFGLAFSTRYRADLVLDGVASCIETEYRKSAAQLGDVDVLEPLPWQCGALARHWCWDFLMRLTLDLSMAVYVLICPGYPTPSTVSSMVLWRQATTSISCSMYTYTHETTSLVDICSHAKRLYDAIDYQSAMPRGTEPYPHLVDGVHEAGMKISFRRVSLRYPGSDRDALHDVSVDILPGELVLVVGTNGSGKSTLLKLLARLFDPTAGEVCVDDVPLTRYDTDQVRGATAFQSQAPVIYPVTVQENIAFGLPPGCRVTSAAIEAAARAGGCTEWIARLREGYETRLKPSFDVNLGWEEGMCGWPSKGLREMLAQRKGHEVAISGGEQQRLASARTWMRIQHRGTRLVVVDEATSALDPIAERDIMTAFRAARAGKTLVCVTHRFHQLAQDADRILCMKDGRVVESGTHAQLIEAGGDYAALYHAQVGSTSTST